MEHDPRYQAIIDEYPTIIANSCATYLSMAEPFPRLSTMIQSFFLSTLKYLSLVALSEYCAAPAPANTELNKAIVVLGRPQYGHWAQFLGLAQKHFQRNPAAMCPQLARVLESDDPGVSPGQLIQALIEIKNRGSHEGYVALSQDAPRYLQKWQEPLLRWLLSLRWICDYPLYHRDASGALLHLAGCTPRPAPAGVCQCQESDYFFSVGDKCLPASPLFLFLKELTGPAEPGLYLFEGATPKLLIYLGHSRKYEDRDAATVQAMRALLDRKGVALSRREEPLSAVELCSAARSSTLARLDQLSRTERFTPEAYVRRQQVDLSFRFWLAGDRTALIVTGEAGSGKSTSLYALADAIVGESDPTLLLLGRELQGQGSEAVESAICAALERLEPFPTLIDTLAEAGSRLIVLIDALEENPQAESLLRGVLALVARYPASKLRVALTLRDFALRRMLTTCAQSIEDARQNLVWFDTEEAGRRESYPYVLLTRPSDQEFAEFFCRYCRLYSIPTALNEIDSTTSDVLHNPLLLKIAAVTYRGRQLPPHLSPHTLFAEYLRHRLGNPYGGGSPSLPLARRFVQLMLERRAVQLTLDEVLDDRILGPASLVSELHSPYNRLLDESVIVQSQEGGFFGTTWLRVNFDRVHEVLLADCLKTRSVPELAEMVRQKPLYPPLVGALAIRLLQVAENEDLTAFVELVPALDDPDVRQAASRALEDLTYTRFDFVRRVVLAWGRDASPVSRQACRSIVVFCHDTGRWALGELLYRALRGSPGSDPRAPAMPELDLVFARMANAQGHYDEALPVVQQYVDSPDPAVRKEALCTLSLIYDDLDVELMRSTSLRCLEEAEATGDDDLLAFAYWSLGGYEEYRGEYAAALDWYQKVFELEKLAFTRGERLGMRPFQSSISCAYLWSARALALIPERTLEAEWYYKRALEMSMDDGDFYRVSVAWNNLSDYYRLIGRVDDALAYSDKELSQSTLYPNDPEWACSYYVRSFIMLMLDRCDEAVQLAERSVAIGESPSGHDKYLPYSYFALCCALLRRGDDAAARTAGERLRLQLQRVAEVKREDHLLLQMTELAWDLAAGAGDPTRISAAFEQYAVANRRVQGCEALGLALLPALQRGVRSEAVHHAARLLVAEAIAIQNRFWEPFVRSRLAVQ